MTYATGKIDGVNISIGSLDGYYLQALDTGNGTISYEDFQKRMLYIKDDLHQTVVNARGQGVSWEEMINYLSTNATVQNWLNDVKPILLQGTGTEPGKVLVQFTIPERPPSNKTDGLKLPEGMNTLTLPQLEDAFDKTVSDNKGIVNAGIGGGHINLEDSLPWFEIEFNTNFGVKKAKEFCQKLSDSMNVLILFNRVESDSKTSTVYGVMDIDYEEVEKGCSVVPALSRDGDWSEYMEDYGTPILPTHTKKNGKAKKLKF